MVPERIEREILIEAPPETVWAVVTEPEHVGGWFSDSAETDELLSAVADPTRRRVLDVLLDRGEATATGLAGELPVTRQAVTKQLAVLNRAGLVEGRRRGREVRFAVRPERLDVATRSMARLAAQWDRRLAAIKRIAEAAAREHENSTHETKEVRR